MAEQKKNIVIKRISTPEGDVPKAEGVVEAFNIVISKISELNKRINDNLKIMGTKDLTEITTDLTIAKDEIIELKNKIETNEKDVDEANKNLNEFNTLVKKMENIIEQVSDENNEINLNSSGNSQLVINEIKGIAKEFERSLGNFKGQKNESIKSSEIEDVFIIIKHEDIKITLNKLGNYQTNKDILLSRIRLIKLPKQILNFDSKILLYGPSGNGKTSITLAVAKELEINIIELNLPLLLSNPIKHQIDLLNSMIIKIKSDENLRPCIILIENIQIINEQTQSSTIMVNFTNILDQINLLNDKILVICTTRDLELLEYSIISRFDELCEFSNPIEIARSEIINNLLEDIKLGEDLDIDVIISTLSSDDKTIGFSCREIARIIEKAYFRVLNEEKDYLTETDIYFGYQQVLAQKSKSPSRKIKLIQSKIDNKVKVGQNPRLEALEYRIESLNSQIVINRKVIKNALRLALSDNYNLINSLVKLFETEQTALSLQKIQKVSSMDPNTLNKTLRKNPYNIIFPKIGNNFTIAFSKNTYDEIITEFELKE